MNALEKCVGIVGTQRKFAEKVGATQQSVSAWLRKGKVGDGFAIAAARAVDFQVTPHELRADHYPHPDDGLPEAMREQSRAAE